MTRAAALALIVVIACGGVRTQTQPRPQLQTQPRPQLQPFDSAPAGPRSGRAGLFERVAVIGASVSAGFTAPRVAVKVKEAMSAEYQVHDGANVWMFRGAWEDGRRQIDAARAFEPTLTIALDFLFWYAYRSTDADERMASLERGLAELDRLSGPLALGDLPDMRGANHAILSPAAVPSTDELARMNARVHAWAAARPHTVILPLGAWSQRLATAERIELGPGETVEARSLLFVDGLHVNALGLWWLLAQIDETLEQELGAEEDGLRFIR